MTKPTYYLRNSLLLSLGFSSYANYLFGPLWAEIRNVVLDRDNHRCRLCGLIARIIHHLDYDEDTMLGNSFDGLVSLCHGCHDKVEFTKAGNKRTLVQAIIAYRKLSKKSQVRHLAKRLAKKDDKPRCPCGRFRKYNRSKCRVCEPNGKIVANRGNKHLTNNPL